MHVTCGAPAPSAVRARTAPVCRAPAAALSARAALSRGRARLTAVRGGCTRAGASVAQHAQCSSLVESSRGSNPALESAILAALGSCVTSTDLGLPGKRVGKVRDTYDCGDCIVIVTTDRQSAFDRLLAAVPFKGRVLNGTSAWWMAQTKHVAPNALLAVPHPNVAIMRKCTVFPVEFVVRGYMTGSTSTSIWTQYAKGVRSYCGATLPEGLRKNDVLPTALVTPTTKAEDHDELISPQEIVARGLMTQAQWDAVSSAALALFAFGQAAAASRGLLLVDTKYEFGLDADGNALLIDEIHTPDSSRYWVASTYEARHGAGQEPENIDKEFLRLWFASRCDPYNDKTLPEAPPELVAELSRRYVLLHDTITGQRFEWPRAGQDAAAAMRADTAAALAALRAPGGALHRASKA